MLPIDFYKQDTLAVARELVGTRLHVVSHGNELIGKIVETEAYLGEDDPASHAANGPTPRSKIMFGPPGVAYVYLIYGVHHCLNFVTEPEGKAGAVLIRALEPLQGQEIMARSRGWDVARGKDQDLCNGPGKLCQALGITRDWNAMTLDGRDQHRIWVSAGQKVDSVEVSPRIGISKAGDFLFRFSDAGSHCRSR